MNKKINVFMLETARDFMRDLDDPIKKQFSKYINRVREGYQGEWFKKMEGSDGIWEFRVIHQKNAYRLFAFWDSSSDTETLIVCTHGINKKTNKTPKKEIEKAQKIKESYFE